MLCAIEEYHPLFRNVSKNPNLMEEGIRLNPDAVPLDRLKEEAWKILEPAYPAQLQTILEAARSWSCPTSRCPAIRAWRQSTASDITGLSRAGVCPSRPRIAMTQCPHCQLRVPDDSTFCPRCGEGLRGKRLLVWGLLLALSMPLWMGLVWWTMRSHYAHTPHTQQADPARYRDSAFSQP